MPTRPAGAELALRARHLDLAEQSTPDDRMLQAPGLATSAGYTSHLGGPGVVADAVAGVNAATTVETRTARTGLRIEVLPPCGQRGRRAGVILSTSAI
jgi:hypothetical protein